MTTAETPLYKRLAELHERLTYLQASDNPRDAEEFVCRYPERRELKELGIHSAS